MPPKRVINQLLLEIFTDGDENEVLSSAFSAMRIINSTRAVWPIVELYFHIDNQPIIEKNIYGKKDIEVKIWYTAEDGDKVPEPMIWNLLYLESNVELPPKREKNGPWDDESETQKRLLKVACLSKPSFLSMTQFVNRLWEGDDTGLTPLDAIKELLDTKGIEYRIRDEGLNEDTMPQLLVPPMSMRNAVDYIHEKFGIFEGPLFRYANYAGQFCMWDLKKMWEETKDAPFTQHHKMPNFLESPDIFKDVNERVISEPDQFITYDLVQALHYANSNVVKHGYDNIFITHPHEDIAFFHKWNVDQIVEEYGLWHTNPELKYHEELKHRKLYYYDQKGFEIADGYTGEYNDFMMRSEISDMFKDAASIKFTIYRNVKISLMQRVGEVFYLKPYADHERFPGSSYEGAYMVTDSEVVLSKMSKGYLDDNLECVATVIGCRTAQSKD
jgi:hypothetical protein